MKLTLALIEKLNKSISASIHYMYKLGYLVPNLLARKQSFTKFPNHSLYPKPTLKNTSKNKTIK